jgi:hypothetical protein
MILLSAEGSANAREGGEGIDQEGFRVSRSFLKEENR